MPLEPAPDAARRPPSPTPSPEARRSPTPSPAARRPPSPTPGPAARRSPSPTQSPAAQRSPSPTGLWSNSGTVTAVNGGGARGSRQPEGIQLQRILEGPAHSKLPDNITFYDSQVADRIKKSRTLECRCRERSTAWVFCEMCFAKEYGPNFFPKPAIKSTQSNKSSMKQSINEEVARFVSMEQRYFEEVARFARSPAFSPEGELVSFRRPIPAPIVHHVLHLARNSRSDKTQRGRLLRCAATASILAFAFQLRGYRLVHLRRQDVATSADGLVIHNRVKTRSRTVDTTLRRAGRDEIYHVISSWLADFRASPAACLWTIDGASSHFPVVSFRVLREELSGQFMVPPEIGGAAAR